MRKKRLELYINTITELGKSLHLLEVDPLDVENENKGNYSGRTALQYIKNLDD